jgi:diaminopimelate epimerase
VRFAKYEGLGNDFILIDGKSLDREAVRALCDRHRGVGADGVIAIDRSGPHPYMHVTNSDGSVPEMCGNGLRCVVLHLVRAGVFAPAQSFVVDTDAGPHGCSFDNDLVTVEMAVPSLDPGDLPVVSSTPLVDAPFAVGAETLHVTAVSMGNPHAVFFDEVGPRRLELGPMIGADPRFPKGVNVGFARPKADSIELFVFERGAGWTEACGTGAAAAAVAAVETGRFARGTAIPVDLPGGRLVLEVGERGRRVRMTGPARHVFDGVVPG